MSLLAHFTTSDKLERILETKCLRFGCLESTNDPYENRNILFSYRIPTIDGSMLLTLSDYYYKNEKSKDKFYILCFSNRNDRYELLNKPRMWSQYTNNHNGCCIILNKIKFDDVFDKMRHQKKIRSKIEYNLNKYRCRIDDLSRELSRYVDNKTPIDDIRDFIWKNNDIYIFKKMEDWKEEAEYRYCIYSSRINDNIYIDLFSSIDSIVIGDKISNFMRNAIWEYCKKYNIKLYQLYWNNGTPVEQDVATIIDKERKNNILKKEDILI